MARRPLAWCIRFESTLQPVGGVNASPQDAAAFVLSAMAAERFLDAQDSNVRAAAEREQIELFNPNRVEGQGVMMQGRAWLVSANL